MSGAAAIQAGCCCIGANWYLADRCTCSTEGALVVRIMVNAHPEGDQPGGTASDFVFNDAAGVCYIVPAGSTPTVSTTEPLSSVFGDWADCPTCCGAPCLYHLAPCTCTGGADNLYVRCSSFSVLDVHKYADDCYIVEEPALDELPAGGVLVVPYGTTYATCAACCAAGDQECPDTGCPSSVSIDVDFTSSGCVDDTRCCDLDHVFVATEGAECQYAWNGTQPIERCSDAATVGNVTDVDLACCRGVWILAVVGTYFVTTGCGTGGFTMVWVKSDGDADSPLGTYTYLDAAARTAILGTCDPTGAPPCQGGTTASTVVIT